MKFFALIFILSQFHSVYNLPANEFIGKWAYEIKGTQIGDVQGTISLKNENDQWSGSISGGDQELSFRNISFNGNVLSCTFYYGDLEIPLTLEHKDGALHGKMKVSDGEHYSFVASKKN